MPASAVPPPVPRQTPPARQSAAAPAEVAAADASSWWTRQVQQLQREEGAGLLLSFVIHLAFLSVLMLVPAFGLVKMPEAFSTILSPQDEPLTVGDTINTELTNPLEGDPGTEDAQARMLDQALQSMQMPELNTSLLSSFAGESGELGAEDGVGGIRLPNPKNAVQAGSFTVWAWPIASGKGKKGELLHDEPGAAPKVLQAYHVVIRMRAPRGTETVDLADFTGRIIGTDGYQQDIPQEAYYYDDKGRLQRAQRGAKLPIIDGTAELLIRVPGAKIPLVQDTITVVSKILNEEQEIQLVFQEK